MPPHGGRPWQLVAWLMQRMRGPSVAWQQRHSFSRYRECSSKLSVSEALVIASNPEVKGLEGKVEDLLPRPVACDMPVGVLGAVVVVTTEESVVVSVALVSGSTAGGGGVLAWPAAVWCLSRGSGSTLVLADVCGVIDTICEGGATV